MNNLDHFPPRYVDVDLRDAASGGYHRGCNPEQYHRLGEHCPIFGEAFADKIIPRSQWRQILEDREPEYSRHKSWQYDQKQEGTCTGNAQAGSISYIAHKGLGIKIAPSPISMYKFCARGPQSGSTTSCILKRSRDHGVLLIDTPEHRKFLEDIGADPNHVLQATGYYQRFPSGWEETAALIQVDEFYELNSIDEFFSALLLGMDVLYGRDGHAIHGVDCGLYRGDFACLYDNSWGGQWGQNGFGIDTYDYLRRKLYRYGAYAVQSLKAIPGIENVIGPVPVIS